MAVMVARKRQNAFRKGEKRRKRALARNLYIGLATLANLDLRGDGSQFKEGVLPPKAHNRDQGLLAQDDSSAQASRVPTAARPNHRLPGGHGCLAMGIKSMLGFCGLHLHHTRLTVQVEHLNDQ